MGKQVKEFETINTELNHESADQKGIYKKNKLILIISATLIAIILFVVLLIAVIIPTSKANAYIEKLDTWVSLMNYEGVSEEERKSTAFKNKIKDLHDELGFSSDLRVKKIPMDALMKYILTNDVDRLLTATMNANSYDYNYPDADWRFTRFNSRRYENNNCSSAYIFCNISIQKER